MASKEEARVPATERVVKNRPFPRGGQDGPSQSSLLVQKAEPCSLFSRERRAPGHISVALWGR